MICLETLFELATPEECATYSTGQADTDSFGRHAQVCVRLCVSSEYSERVANFHALAWRNALSGQFKLD
jgi:hypothetical protein